MVKREIKISVPGDVKILYSDSVIIRSNKFGLVLDFAQQVAPRQQQVVARVGMSREHAQAFARVLTKHLQAKPRKPTQTVIH